jgi:hypothetical protein
MMCSHRNRQLAAVVVVVLVLVSVVPGGVAFRADYSINSITQDEGTRLTGSTTDD